MKNLIKNEGLVTCCFSNISKMSIFQYMWYYSEMNLEKKSSILWFLLFLFCPWYDIIWWRIIKEKEILDLTILEFLIFILILAITVSGLGFIFSIIHSHSSIKDAREFCNRRTS